MNWYRLVKTEVRFEFCNLTGPKIGQDLYCFDKKNSQKTQNIASHYAFLLCMTG